MSGKSQAIDMIVGMIGFVFVLFFMIFFTVLEIIIAIVGALLFMFGIKEVDEWAKRHKSPAPEDLWEKFK